MSASICAAGCGASHKKAAPAASAGTNTAGPAPTDDLRLLPESAVFKDLVSAANLIDQRALDSSAERCLLQGPARPGDRWRIKADLAAAVRPLPEPPGDLESRLRGDAKPVTVLSRWGRTGSETYSLALVAFTTTSAASARLPVLAIFITKAGPFLRAGDDATGNPAAGPLRPDELALELVKRGEKAELSVYVTAEPDVAVGELYKLLKSLPETRLEVALAVALPAGTRLPGSKSAAAAAESKPQPWCAEGLPEPSENAPEGDLPAQTIAAALGPLREEAQNCLAGAEAGAMAGGAVTLALRIGPEGRVQTACLLEDEIRDLSLAGCLVERAGKIVFPKPEPPGFVDAHVPLRLAAPSVPRQRPICE